MSKFLPRISKIIFAPIIGGLLVAGSLPVWGSGPEETKPTSIIAGVVSNFPPYYQTDKSGNPTGFAIDVLNGVAKHVGLAVTYRSFKAPRDMRAALRAGHVHVVPKNKEFDRTISLKKYSTPAGADSLAEILMRSRSSPLIYC